MSQETLRSFNRHLINNTLHPLEALERNKSGLAYYAPDEPLFLTLEARLEALADLGLPAEEHERMLHTIDCKNDNPSLGGEVFYENGLVVNMKTRLPRLFNRFAKEVMPDTAAEAEDKEAQAPAVARIDFWPWEEEKKTKHHREQNSETILTALEALEDYVYLVDNGVIPKPTAIYGFTNPDMARFATRAGFKQRRSPVHPNHRLVMARYEDVQKAVRGFDPRLKGVLIKRAGRQQELHAAKAAAADSVE